MDQAGVKPNDPRGDTSIGALAPAALLRPQKSRSDFEDSVPEMLRISRGPAKSRAIWQDLVPDMLCMSRGKAKQRDPRTQSPGGFASLREATTRFRGWRRTCFAFHGARSSCCFRHRRGVTLIEVLVSMGVIVIVSGGVLFSLMQSSRYVKVSQDIREVVTDLQIVTERFQSAPLGEVFATFPHGRKIDESVIGAYALPDEEITVAYTPGDVRNVVRNGNNQILFHTDDDDGDYLINGASFRITYEDESVQTFNATGGFGQVTMATPRTVIIPVNGSFLVNAKSVSLRMNLDGVDESGEVLIRLNNRGPYTPGPPFAGNPSVKTLLLPSLTPLRITFTCTWITDGHELTRTLTTARMP